MMLGYTPSPFTSRTLSKNSASKIRRNELQCLQIYLQYMCNVAVYDKELHSASAFTWSIKVVALKVGFMLMGSIMHWIMAGIHHSTAVNFTKYQKQNDCFF